MQNLKKWLVENRACPDISRLLVQAINQWRREEKITMMKNYEIDGVTDMFGGQEEIGWTPLIGGCLSE